MANSYTDVVNSQRELLIAARVREEAKLEEFAKCVNSVNKSEVFPGIYIPDDLSLRALCPEAYAENPDPAVYDEQFKKMMEIITPINERMDAINREAAACIAEYKQMA